MRLASSKRLSSLGLLLALSSASAFAAPTISRWSVQSDGTRERVEVRWSEVAPVEISEFAQARQVVVVMPGATLANGTPTRLADNSALVRRARLQEVTLPDGRQGVQLTLSLNEWTTVTSTSTDTGLSLEMPLPVSLVPVEGQALASSQRAGLELTDEKIAELGTRPFGSVLAPETGAGQAPSTGSSAISDYFVPPNVQRTAAEGASQTMTDIEVNSKLNEFVRRVDFQGTSLENVLRLISEEAELNILIRPADVQGRTVTLRLRNVTLRQMLEAILKANNLGYTIEDGGIVRIVPRDQVKSSTRETVTETIAINWVDAVEVADALKPFVDKDEGTLQVSRANNTIIIRDVPETVNRIQQLVSQLDVPEKQVLIEMRLVNMTESARRAFGVRSNWETQSTESRFLRDPEGNFFDNSEFTNSLRTLTNTNTATNGTVSTITQNPFDRTINQVITSNGNNTNTITDTTNLSSALVPTSRAGAGLLAPNANAFGLSSLFSPTILGTKYDVDLQINAEENRGEAVTLAAPTVLSLNNQEATVEIKRKIPYVSAVNSDQGSVATIEFIDVGTTVKLLPRITNNGYVMMQIEPEQILDTGERPGGVPVTDERRVLSSVIVRDEQVVALGGLREFVATSSENGVPYLLRVPVLSWLFKNQENRQNKTELYLFVMPQIVKDPTPTAYQTALYEKIDYNWDLPDYYFDEIRARKAPGEENNPNSKR